MSEKYIPTYSVSATLESIRKGEITKEEAIAEYERIEKIYSDCKDGSAGLSAHLTEELKEALKWELY